MILSMLRIDVIAIYLVSTWVRWPDHWTLPVWNQYWKVGTIGLRRRPCASSNWRSQVRTWFVLKTTQ